MPVLFPKRLRGWRFLLLNLMLGLGHMVVLFNAGSYVALLPHAASDLGGVLPSFGTWAQTDFMVALALGFPLARWLAFRVGNYRLFVAAFVLYSGASYLCAISQTLWLFLPARVLLGLAGGITLPLGQALWLNEYPDRLKSLGLGVWGLFTLMPFTIGLPLGGWIADELGWRYLFYLNIPMAVAIAGITGSLLYGRGFERRFIRFDVVGFALLVLVLGGVQTLLNMGNDFDWLDSPFLRGVLVAILVALPCLVIWELGERHPAVDVRLFAHRNFAIGVLCLTAGFLSIQGLLALFIVQLQVLLGYSSFLAGLVFLPMILLGAPAIAVMHELCKRIDARWLASLSCLGFAGVFYWIGLFDDPHSYDQIFWPMLFEGLFLGSFFTPLTVLTLHGLSGRVVGRAAELAALLRIAAGAFGIAFQGIVLFRRAPFHQLNLSDHFGGRQFVSFDGLEHVSAKLGDAGLDPAMVQGKLTAIIKQSAAILGLNDAFLVASYIFLGLAALVWLAEPTQLPAHQTVEEELPEMLAEELGMEVP
ncbi:MAG: DHA2 family efflux MFS transporter permease subunit [Nitrospirae bacterium]|nr:MAG: DHA2 family efflux MFS transporter permease subunit [Nitrospirota bacterium]